MSRSNSFMVTIASLAVCVAAYANSPAKPSSITIKPDGTKIVNMDLKKTARFIIDADSKDGDHQYQVITGTENLKKAITTEERK